MSGKRWLNGTTRRNANSTCTPGSATLSSWSSSPRFRSSRSFSDSSRLPLFVSPEASMRGKGKPARRTNRRTGSDAYRDLDEVFDRLPPDLARVEPDLDRDDVDRDDVERLPLDRLALDFARVEPDLDLDELDDEREREALDPLPLDLARVEPDLARDDDEPDREPLDDRRLEDRRRDDPPFHSAAGISSRATAFASCSIC